MRSTYREFEPSPDLGHFVECFWTGEVVADHTARILPDGCADIIFFFRDSELIEAQVVGVMTHAHLVPLAAGTFLVGIRFHPGMAGICLRCDMPALKDLAVPLRSVCNFAADHLVPVASRRNSIESRIAAIEESLGYLPTINCVQQAILELVGRKGQLSLNEFAAVAGIGERQLRRTCLRHSGLSPKQLARILRFRHVVARLKKASDNMAELALDCGYYDQAHMIRDFRELAGISPLRYLRQRG